MKKHLSFALVLLFLSFFSFNFSEEREKFFFLSFDGGIVIEAGTFGAWRIGGSFEASMKYLGVLANIRYDISEILNVTGYGGAVAIYPEGNAPYGYYIKLGFIYNEGRLKGGESGTFFSVPLELGMKFVFDEWWGLTFDPYLHSEVLIPYEGFYKDKPVSMANSIGVRMGLTF
jgi:hypothetical protein